MSLDNIRQPVAKDMADVEQFIFQNQHSSVKLINQVSNYTIGNGGKRLRPLVLVLVARACGYTGYQHIDLATVLEYVHTATLLHDDVIDDSIMRRGRDTANVKWSNPTSILVGDFLYSRAVQLMVGLENLTILQVLSEAINKLSEGEVLQLMHRHNANISQEEYLTIITNKTGKLFEAAAHLGTILSQAPIQHSLDLQQFGLHLGMAFQLIDDVLDYSVDAAQTGKNMGDDLAEGCPTLPLLYAMWQSPPETSKMIRQAIEKGQQDNLIDMQAAIQSTDAIPYTIEQAKHHTKLAYAKLQCLAPSIYKTALEQLIEFAVIRQH